MLGPTRVRFSLQQLLAAMTWVAIFIYAIDRWVLGWTVVQVALPTLVGALARLFRILVPERVLPWVAIVMLVASITTISVIMVKEYGLTVEVAVIHVCYLVFWVPQLALMAALVRPPN